MSFMRRYLPAISVYRIPTNKLKVAYPEVTQYLREKYMYPQERVTGPSENIIYLDEIPHSEKQQIQQIQQIQKGTQPYNL